MCKIFIHRKIRSIDKPPILYKKFIDDIWKIKQSDKSLLIFDNKYLFYISQEKYFDFSC